MIRCKNPILPGFYPDPSICRVGKDFYLVNSTFAYFPGIPVFHSRDLAHWKQIGNVLERSSQVSCKYTGFSDGIYAPTLRYHQGIFYLITTDVQGGGNFIVTARHPQGPWSEPHFLGEEAEGIDPSLFFDEDGSCWYIGQRGNRRGSRYFGDCEIWIQRLNTETFRLEGEAADVLRGFQKKAVWAEGPHLYKKDGYYYILHAEGGTERNHCVAAARSRKRTGPYEYCPANPILTHRHLGRSAAVTCVGHGDLTEDGNGNWYMVVLGCRPNQGYTLTGRETFLARVVWEEDWPVVNPGIGKLQEYVDIPETCADASGVIQDIRVESPCEQNPAQEMAHTWTFGGGKLPMGFLTVGVPPEGMLSFDERPGYLRMRMVEPSLQAAAFFSYIGVRQQHRNYSVETVLELCTKQEKDCAGLAVVQNGSHYIRFVCTLKGKNIWVQAAASRKDGDRVLAEEICGPAEVFFCGGRLALRIEVHGLEAAFLWKSVPKSGEESGGLFGKDLEKATPGSRWNRLPVKADLRFLSTEEAGGFVGCTAGMCYDSAKNSGGYADFGCFTYGEIQ